MQKQYEAREFLSKKKRIVTPNRFASQREAIELVDKLYSSGAKIVSITGIIDYKSEDDICADQMIIQLPEEKEKRAVLFSVCNEEIIKEGFDPEEDKGQKEIKLWWD
jgi:hypothetical protein